jgi:peptide/nickel transport system ATP-binding protein
MVTGAVRFDGTAIPGDEAGLARLRGRRIGVVPQLAGNGLDPLRRLAGQVRDALGLAATVEIPADARGLFNDLGLDAGRMALYPGELSAGERQRAAIGLALAPGPELLIADDPTASLDPVEQRRVLDLFERQCGERGMALLLIAHDLKVIAALCTKIIVLGQGRMLEAGDKVEVLGHPKHDYTRTLVMAGRHRAKTLMRAPIGGPLVEVRHVSRRYRRPDRSIFEPQPPVVALDNVSLTLREGESMALIGPAGSGKSTLARIVAGLERASSGELEFDQVVHHGDDLARPQRAQLSLLFPDPATSFNPRLTVGESIAEPLRLEAQDAMEDLGGRIVEMVNAVGMSPAVLDRYPHEFDRAELQRLAIARALITRPRLVVLDEPVAALDVVARGEILGMLNRLRADYGLSFLVAGHDLEMVRLIADRVVVLDGGKVVETTTPAQLLDKPQHTATQKLVAAALPDVGIVPVF